MSVTILFLASNPKGTSQLDLKEEATAIKRALSKSNYKGRFKFISKRHVGRDNLIRYMLEYRPDIVHFSGHGQKEKGILFENKNGGFTTADSQALGSLFAEFQTIQCVVLNACYTCKQAKVLAADVPCVIGMTREIEDKSAIAFAADFYLGIAFGSSVDSAFTLAKKNVKLQDQGSVDQIVQIKWNSKYSWKTHTIIPPPRSTKKKKTLHTKYLIGKELGTNMMSRTELARDTQLQRDVVIKTLTRPGTEEFFVREVREIAKLAKHPNIVSVYGAWLDDREPHYIRQYIEGESIRTVLKKDKSLSIDFVLGALTAMGDAMLFAQQAGVWQLGIKLEKVLIQKMSATLNLKLSANYNVLIYPEIGTSEYYDENREQIPPESKVYSPPEYLKKNDIRDFKPDDYDKMNQYRLGILGYEMLVPPEEFDKHKEQATVGSLTRSLRAGLTASEQSSDWRSVKSLRNACPEFLSRAIARMIDPEPNNRYDSLEEALADFTHRDLNVEVARDSFRRIIEKEPIEFFRKFYVNLIGKSDQIKAAFSKFGTTMDGSGWRDQYTKLKEALVLLFAFSILKEWHEPTILTRLAQSHYHHPKCYYTSFRDALLDAVQAVDVDYLDPSLLRMAWENACKPGLEYLKTYPEKHPQK